MNAATSVIQGTGLRRVAATLEITRKYAPIVGPILIADSLRFAS